MNPILTNWRAATRARHVARLTPLAALALACSAAGPALAQSCAEWVVHFPGLQPNARSGHTMTFDPVHDVVLLYGGVGPPAFGDTWAWDGGNWIGLGVSGPPARAGQRMAFDTARGVAVLVGNPSTAFVSETWEFDGTNWTQFGGATPPPRFEHAVAFDSVRNKLVLFGGQQQGDEGNFAVGDTWEYNGSSWTQLFPANSPSPRHKHAMAFDSHRARTVLYGGFDSFTFTDSGETWEWDGTDWTLAASSGPPATVTHALVYDSNSQRTILIPGGAPTNDPVVRTWAWDGATWTLLAATDGMQNRDAFAAAFDSTRNTVVVFGGVAFEGEDIIPKSDTWELPSSSPPSITQQPAAVIAPAGGTAHFTVVADGTSLTYQWRKDGNPMNNDGRVNGAFEATLSIAALTTADNGQYSVEVSGDCGDTTSNAVSLAVYARGDMNCDGAVNNFDIDPFVLALVDPTGYAAAFPNCNRILGDIDASNAFNNFDIDPFVALIVGGP